MKIHRDADTEIGVRWYFADDDAPWLDTYTRFASGNWASSKTGWEGVGEVQGAPRPWSNGKRPPGLIGDHICGNLSDFVDGGSVLDPTLCTNEEGVSSCCVDKIFCCDLAKMGPFINLTVRAATTGLPVPTSIGYPGLSFPMVRTAIFPHVEFSTINTVYFPPAITAFFFKITCVDDVIVIASNSGLLTAVIPVDNTQNKPPGIRFKPGQINFILPPFNFNWEFWTMSIGDDPGPAPPSPPGHYLFPPGVFPPNVFPKKTFP